LRERGLALGKVAADSPAHAGCRGRRPLGITLTILDKGNAPDYVLDRARLFVWNIFATTRCRPSSRTRRGAMRADRRSRGAAGGGATRQLHRKNVVLMPSFVNIGAYVDEGTMVDTWATVGSCAQIGKNVHLSGGVGIGGVLEPLQANPTIIEDNCFIGARSEVVEGVIVEENSVLSMGVYIGQSTKIYDRATGEVSYGRVPAGSVVVSGNLPRPTASTACTAR
jgi:acetyltransferase-like isoleucine patch superfamily enzyme